MFIRICTSATHAQYDATPLQSASERSGAQGVGQRAQQRACGRACQCVPECECACDVEYAEVGERGGDAPPVFLALYHRIVAEGELLRLHLTPRLVREYAALQQHQRGGDGLDVAERIHVRPEVAHRSSAQLSSQRRRQAGRQAGVGEACGGRMKAEPAGVEQRGRARPDSVCWFRGTPRRLAACRPPPAVASAERWTESARVAGQTPKRLWRGLQRFGRQARGLRRGVMAESRREWNSTAEEDGSAAQ